MSVNPLVEISVAIRNNWEMTSKFLVNLFQTISTYDSVAVNIIDNASSDLTVNELEKYRDKATIFSNETNKGFAFAHNMILRKSSVTYNCILHNDIKLYSGWLNAMVTHMQVNQKVGILGVTNDIYGTFSLGGRLESDGTHKFVFLDDVDVSLDFVHSSCMLMKSRVYKTVGCFDEKFAYGGNSDKDMCLKAQDVGFEIDVLKDTIVDHFCGPTARLVGLENFTEQNRLLLLKKNEEWFKNNKGNVQFRIKRKKVL